MRRTLFLFPAIAVALLVLAGLLCSDPDIQTVALAEESAQPAADESQPFAVGSPAATNDHSALPFDPDWPQVYQMLAAKCGGCHRPGGKNTDLMSYDAIIAARTEDGQKLVVPGKPSESPLWTQVFWDPTGQIELDDVVEPSMPPEQSEWLTEGQLILLGRWIKNGALQYELPEHCSIRPLMEIDFPSAKECRACHPKQYKEWSRSMHAYAQHSPIFEAFNLTLIERTSGTIGTFCSRCHTPIGTALGENGSLRNVHRSRISMEGVTCVVCHRIAKPYYKSNSRMAIVPGKMLDGCMFGPFENAVSAALNAHDSKRNPYITTSAFCGTCHDVTSPQGMRLEEAFSEWQNSPAAKKGITCQQCHMGPVQGVPIAADHRPLGRAAVVPDIDPKYIPLRPLSDHTFAGPDYSMLPDTEFPEKLDWMYETDYRQSEKLTPYQKQTLNSLRRKNRRQLSIATAKRFELLKNAAEIYVDAPNCAEAGDRVNFSVDVINKVSGHNLPTGFSAERQVWVEIMLFDPHGRIVFQTGHLDRNGDLRDEHSHFVKARRLSVDKHLLNLQSKFVALSNKGTERLVVIPVNRNLRPLNIVRPAIGASASFGRPPTMRLAKGSLPPLSTARKHYSIRLPHDPGLYRLAVRLNFRHLPPILLDEIGTPHLKHLLEVVVIDSSETEIVVGPGN